MIPPCFARACVLRRGVRADLGSDAGLSVAPRCGRHVRAWGPGSANRARPHGSGFRPADRYDLIAVYYCRLRASAAAGRERTVCHRAIHYSIAQRDFVWSTRPFVGQHVGMRD
jgi:hypothetical protein